MFTLKLKATKMIGGDFMEFDKTAVVNVIARRGYSVKHLAQISGVSEPTINRILHHSGKGTLATIGKLAKALKVPASELIKD